MPTALDSTLTGRDIAELALRGWEQCDDFTMAPEDYEAGLRESLIALRWFCERYGIDFDAISQEAAAVQTAQVETCGGEDLDWDREIRNDGESPSTRF